MSSWLPNADWSTGAEETWSALESGHRSNDSRKLYDEINTVRLPLLSSQSFSQIAQEAYQLSSSRAEFHQILEDRSQQAIQDLYAHFEDTADALAADPTLFPDHRCWERFLAFSRTQSLERLVDFLSALLPAAACVVPPAANNTSRISTRAQNRRFERQNVRSKQNRRTGLNHSGQGTGGRYNLRSKRQTRSIDSTG